MKKQLGSGGLVIMYVGNLESYQGIDLLLESFSYVAAKVEAVDLIIVGGEVQDIQKYQIKAEHLGIGSKVYFLGPRPVELLAELLSKADILVSARTKGFNTPMKIYPYLYSGKPVLATDLLTHTQILNDRVAMLAEPFPGPFSQAMLRLIEDPDLRHALGTAGERLAEKEFSYAGFRKKLNALFDWVESELRQDSKSSAVGT